MRLPFFVPFKFHQEPSNGDGKIHKPSRFMLRGKLIRGALFLTLIILGLGLFPYQLYSWRHRILPWQLYSHHSYNKNKKLTVVVPGFGDMSRMRVLRSSLRAIQHNLHAKKYEFECLVYVYKEDILKQATDKLSSICTTIQYNEGLWTHHMKKVPSLDNNNTTHVAVLMDDIDVDTFALDISYMMDRMEYKEYNLFSASFPRGTVYRECLHQRAHCQSHECGYVDILFTLFDTETWKCWQDQIDLETNSYGWGYDVLVPDVCHAKIGVMDRQGVAVHIAHPCAEKEGGCRKSSYDTIEARRQMEEWIDHASKTMTLPGYGNQKNSMTEEGETHNTPAELVYDYRSSVLARWKNYPYCD